MKLMNTNDFFRNNAGLYPLRLETSQFSPLRFEKLKIESKLNSNFREMKLDEINRNSPNFSPEIRREFDRFSESNGGKFKKRRYLGKSSKCIESERNQYDACHNCGINGHAFKNCKSPIVSYGVVQFRIIDKKRQYLMIRRKDTLGYIDFLRGKYKLYDRKYILNMMKQMTNDEKRKIMENDFSTLWKNLWKKTDNLLQKSEEDVSREKYNELKTTICADNKSILHHLIDESNQFECWDEPEWGFPKGRRNYLEKDYDCALREACEETGYKVNEMIGTPNILPFEEVFTGSNYKVYKHKYYLMYMECKDNTIPRTFDSTEIGQLEWKSYEECISSIRPYNVEKKKVIQRIENFLQLHHQIHFFSIK